MLPEDWKKHKLGEIADITSSKRIFLSDYVDKGIPFYRSKEIIEKANGGEISVELFITNERYNAIKQKFGSPVNGDLLIAAVGERAGIPYCVKNDGDFYFKDGNLIWLRYFNKATHSKFLYYYLRTKTCQSALESTMIGSAQKALTIIGLKNLEVSLPPIYAQTRIASILSSLDNKIELNLQMNKTLEAIAQAIFKEWFVDFRFPGFDGELVDGLPKDWRRGNYSDLAIIETGKGLKREEYISDGQYSVIGANGVIGNTNKYLYDDKLILTGRVGTLGQIKISMGKCWISDNVLISKPNQYFFYTYSVLKSINLTALNRGSTQPLITQTDLKNQPVIMPDNCILASFEDHVADLYFKIYLNNNQNQTLTQIRDNLLPKLMTGKIRVF